MRITPNNIKEIDFFVGEKRSVTHCAELLFSLMHDLENVNKTLRRIGHGGLYIDYIEEHTAYSPERVDPCPDYYGMFVLRMEDNMSDSVGVEMTLSELDSVLCTLCDFSEKYFET